MIGQVHRHKGGSASVFWQGTLFLVYSNLQSDVYASAVNACTRKAASQSNRRAADFPAIDRNLPDEERHIRDTVRAYVRNKVTPNVGDWFEGAASRPRAGQGTGPLNVLGMHPDGYGCAGACATAYGVACMELEAGDSGPRSRLGPGLAGDVRDLEMGLGGAEAGVAAPDGRRRGDRLLRPDRARRGLRPRRDAYPRPPRRRRLGSNGAKMWITNGSIADVAVVWAQTDDGVRGFVVPKGTPGFTTREIHKKMCLRASVTS